MRILFLFLLAGLSACSTADLYEKDLSIPRHEWSSSFRPAFEFNISDTTASYQLFVVLRHTEKYNYNNIWLTLTAQAPAQAPQSFQLELPLATSANGWLATGMDDLYEHRIPVTLDPAKFSFAHAGTYHFTLAQIMREDPLQQVLNVGLRIEKKQ